jgi:predicted alpha/beta hydrolase
MPERLTALTGDGVRLVMRRHRPAGAARAVCLAGHAMIANSSYLERRGFADHLARCGIDFFALDFRGHGESVPPSPRGGAGWSFDHYMRFDLPAALSAVSAATGRETGEVCYLGHSLGGLVGLAAFGTGTAPTPARLSLWATAVWLGESWRRQALFGAFALSARLFGYAPMRLLRIGTDDEPRVYVEDLFRWIRTARWTSRDGVDYRALVPSIVCPVWVVAGEGDSLCRPEDAERLRRLLPAAPPLRRVGRAQGDAIDPDHFQLFTVPQLRPLWDELARFLTGERGADALGQPGPPGAG